MRVETDGERAVRRLQHLGHGADDRPLEIAGERDHLARRDAGVLGVTAVECAAHAAHHRRDLSADRELPARAPGDHARSFDAQDAREGHPGSEALARMQLGAIQPECLDLDQYPTRRRSRNGDLADRERIGRARRVEDDRSHGVGHPSLQNSDIRLGAVAYSLTRSPDAVETCPGPQSRD